MSNHASLHRIGESRIEIISRWNTVEEATENVEKRRGISNEIGVLQEKLREEIFANQDGAGSSLIDTAANPSSFFDTAANPLFGVWDIDDRTRLGKLVEER